MLILFPSLDFFRTQVNANNILDGREVYFFPLETLTIFDNSLLEYLLQFYLLYIHGISANLFNKNTSLYGAATNLISQHVSFPFYTFRIEVIYELSQGSLYNTTALHYFSVILMINKNKKVIDLSQQVCLISDFRAQYRVCVYYIYVE